MLEIITGTLVDVAEKNTKGGKAIIVDITRRVWDSGVKSYVPGDTLSVWYCNEATQRAQHVLNKKQDYLNKTVILMANREDGNGKTSYYGRLAPTTYGLLRVPVQLNPNATDEDFMNADMGIEDCMDAGILDPMFSLNLEEKDTAMMATNIWTAISVLTAARKNSADYSDAIMTTLTDTLTLLNKLVVPPTAAYIGMIMSHTIYDQDRYPNINLSITIPTRSNGTTRGTQWCSCKVFAPNKPDQKNTSAYARLKYYLDKKVIKDKDKIILYLSGEQERNGQPSFTCYAYTRLP
jgi:hypothetical protein